MDIKIKEITPCYQGFAELKLLSITEGFNMLRRLEDNWRSGENRFDMPGEKLLGAYDKCTLVGVCGLNIDPFSTLVRTGRLRHLYVDLKYRRKHVGSFLLNEILSNTEIWFDCINTNAPSTAFTFYERAGFEAVSDSVKVTHRLCLATSLR